MTEKERPNIDFLFECESCAESWSENFLDLINCLTPEELKQVSSYIKKKLD